MKVLVMLALALMAGALAACGATPHAAVSGNATAKTVALVAPDKVTTLYIGLADISTSTKDVHPHMLNDMEEFARRAAREKAMFYVDAFGAQPQKTTDWPVSADFAATNPGYGGNETLEAADRQRRAAQLRSALAAVLEKPVDGSGTSMLAALELAGQLRQQMLSDVHVVIGLFTDGGLVEGGYDFRRNPPSDVKDATLREWPGRLKGLTGADVLVSGVGYHTDIEHGQLVAVHDLLQDLLERAGARLVVWDVRLAQSS